MDTPKVNTLENYKGHEAIKWVKAHVITGGTFWKNEELYCQSIQFHQHLYPGRISFHIHDRLDGIIRKESPNSVCFDLNNVAEVTVLEYPEQKERQIEVIVGLNNGADLCIALDRKRNVREVSVSLDKEQEQ